MNKVNRYSTDRSRFDNDESFYKHIGTIISNLTDDEYICVVRYEDCGIYVIDFECADPDLGAPYPRWLTPEEYESIVYMDDNC